VFRTMFLRHSHHDCGYRYHRFDLPRLCLRECISGRRKRCSAMTRMGQWLSDHSDKALASFTWRMIWITQTDCDSDAHRNDPYN